MGALVLLVITAGCSTIAGPPDRPVLSVTPAEVPDDPPPSETATPHVDRPSGRFADPTAMAAAHRAVLANTSYTVVLTQTTRFPGTADRSDWQLVGRFAPGDRFAVVTERNGSVFRGTAPIHMAFYSDGRRVVQAVTANESRSAAIVLDTRDTQVAPQSVLPVNPRFDGELARVFASTAITSVDRVQPIGPGNAVVELWLTGPVDAARPPSLTITTRVQNVTARLVIDERGFVHAFEVRYVGSFAGRPVVVTRSVSYRAVGATAVPRPAWAAAALNGTATAGSPTGNGSA